MPFTLLPFVSYLLNYNLLVPASGLLIVKVIVHVRIHIWKLYAIPEVTKSQSYPSKMRMQ